MSAIAFKKVIAKDGLTPAERFASMVKEDGVFYAVGNELYLKDVLLSSTTASEVTVVDSAGNFEGTDVEAVLAELATMVGNQEITVTKTTGGSGDNYAYRYVFSQGETPITNGTIDIMKDMVATSGTVVYPSAEHPIIIDGQTITSGTYIELVIANGDPFYINVADLIEYNTFVDTDEFTFADNNHQITVTVGKIAGNKIIYRFADPTADPPITELTINAKVDQVEGRVAALENYVGTIPQESSAQDVIGYVDEKTGSGVSALNGEAEVASKSSGDVVTIKGSIIEVEGVISNGPSAAKSTVIDGYLNPSNGKFYQEAGFVTEITPVTTNSYKDLTNNTVYNWTGKKFVPITPDVALAKLAVTGNAADAAIADAGGFFAGANVETALQELGAATAWEEV